MSGGRRATATAIPLARAAALPPRGLHSPLPRSRAMRSRMGWGWWFWWIWNYQAIELVLQRQLTRARTTGNDSRWVFHRGSLVGFVLYPEKGAVPRQRWILCSAGSISALPHSKEKETKRMEYLVCFCFCRVRCLVRDHGFTWRGLGWAGQFVVVGSLHCTSTTANAQGMVAFERRRENIIQVLPEEDTHLQTYRARTGSTPKSEHAGQWNQPIFSRCKTD